MHTHTKLHQSQFIHKGRSCERSLCEHMPGLRCPECRVLPSLILCLRCKLSLIVKLSCLASSFSANLAVPRSLGLLDARDLRTVASPPAACDRRDH